MATFWCENDHVRLLHLGTFTSGLQGIGTDIRDALLDAAVDGQPGRRTSHCVVADARFLLLDLHLHPHHLSTLHHTSAL